MEETGNKDQPLSDDQIRKIAAKVHQLGLSRLSHEIDDERFIRKSFEILVEDYISEAESRFLERQEDEIREKLLSFQMMLTDKASSYNNIVITLGFAGFFGIWNFIRDSMNEFDEQIIAFLLGTSLIVFITWTLRVSFRSGKSNSSIINVYTMEFRDNEEFLSELKKQEKISNLKTAQLMKFYYPVFYSFVMAGFSAGFILLAILSRNIFYGVSDEPESIFSTVAHFLRNLLGH